MKTLLSLITCATLAVTAHAQKLTEKQVPAAAVAAFKKAQPKATAVKWEKEAANFEAGFHLGKEEMSVVISPTGTLLETEAEMSVAQLPAPVQASLARDYKDYKVTEAAKIVTAATGATTYEAEVTQGGKHRDVLFNADGTEVKK